MTAFIRGLFGAKGQAVDIEAIDTSASKPARPVERSQPQPSGTFFLDTDAARSYGDAQYMRAKKTVRRTFPKTVDSPEHKEYVQQVSATDRRENFSEPSAAPTNFTPQQSQQPQEQVTPTVTPSRRSGDSGMDLFRNMAKDLRK